MKHIQRIISFLLALVMAIGMVPSMAGNAEETEPTKSVIETTAETTVPIESINVSAEETVAFIEEIEVEEPDIIPVELVAISQLEGLTELTVGETLQLTATILPENVTDTILVWSSSDEAVATVDEDGNVTGRSVGNVVITVTCGDRQGRYTLSIVEAFVKDYKQASDDIDENVEESRFLDYYDSYSNGSSFYKYYESEYYINTDDKDYLYVIHSVGEQKKVLNEHVISMIGVNQYIYLLIYKETHQTILMKFNISDYSTETIVEFDGIVSNFARRDTNIYYIDNNHLYGYNLRNKELKCVVSSEDVRYFYFKDYNTLKYYNLDNAINILCFNNDNILCVNNDNDVAYRSRRSNSKAHGSSYIPRLTEPATDDPYYTSLNPFHKSGYGMVGNGGNCTCYAYGRSYENLGSEPSLSLGNAGKWYEYNKDNNCYSYGMTPQLGAVAVWTKDGGSGHVAVVEVIDGDTVVTSESGWQQFYFKTKTRSASDTNFSGGSAYNFEGFIYVLGTNDYYPSYGGLSVTQDSTEVMSMPYRAETNEKSIPFETASKGDYYLSLGLYKNNQGELWYHVKEKTTFQDGYIHAGSAAFTEQFTEDSKITDMVVPITIKQGDSFPLEGNVEALFNGISSISAYVYSGTATSGTHETGITVEFGNPTHNYALAYSKVDSGVKFGSLEPGDYTFCLTVQLISYNAKSATEVDTPRYQEISYTTPFTVVKKDIDPEPVEYTVFYDANGGSEAPTSQIKVHDQTLILSSTVPTRDGYTFLGWATDVSATSATYSAGGNYTDNTSVTLYAVWEAVNIPETPEIIMSGAYGNNLTWTLDDAGTLTISGVGEMAQMSVSEIPWWDYRSTISAVVIDDGITSISDKAFYYCPNLKSLSLPDSLISIGSNAFYNAALTDITFPGNLSRIGDYAFANCSSLENIVLPNSLTSIGDYAFYFCKGPEKITLPNGLISIGANCFAYCNGLNSIVIPKGDIGFGTSAFRGCYALTDVYYTGAEDQLAAAMASFLESTRESYTSHEDASSLRVHYTQQGSVSAKMYIGLCGDKMTWTLKKGLLNISGEGVMEGYPWRENADIITEISISEGVTEISQAAFGNLYIATKAVIPSSVTKVGNRAFQGLSGLQQVAIMGPAALGNYAFSSCSNLETVVLSKDIPSMGVGAFDEYCSSLRNVLFSGTQEEWDLFLQNVVKADNGNSALQNASNIVFNWTGALENLPEFPDQPEFVPSGTCGENLTWELDENGWLHISGTGAMDSWENSEDCPWYGGRNDISMVTIEEGVTDIGRMAFAECFKLSFVSIPQSVASIGENAFQGCNALTSAYYDGSEEEWNALIPHIAAGNDLLLSVSYMEFLPEIPESSTSGTCGDNLTWTLQDSILTISGTGPMTNYEQNGAPWQDGAYLIQKINLPEGLTSIGAYAFMSTGIRYINIPVSVQSIGKGAFSHCQTLSQASIPEGITRIEDYTFSGCRNLRMMHRPDEEALGEYYNQRIVSLPSSVTSIGAYAFWNCSQMGQLYLPEELTAIGNNAFISCSSLSSVVIPENVTELGEAVFESCTSLTNVKFPKGITTLPKRMFANCSGLAAVEIPATIAVIDPGVFQGCSKLNNVVIPSGVMSVSTGCFEGCTSLSSITIPDSVTSIGSSAFSECSALTNITIPDSVTSIGMNAFSDCTGLTSISIPASVSSMDAYVFSGCTGLTSAVLPAGMSELTWYTFYNCSGLKEVYIPATITSIGIYAFHNCTSLTDVYYGGTEEQWEALLKTIISSGNYLLFSDDLTVHYNWIREEPVYLERVLYFNSWEENTNTVFFGADAEISLMVTEETDISTVSDLRFGRYVVVQTRTEGDQEILLSTALPVTKKGAVTAANNSQITINDVSYTTPKDLLAPESYLNKQVVYHIYNNKLAGIEMLQEKEGYLTHWHSGGRQLKVQSSAAINDPQYYHLSYASEDDSDAFLSLSVDESGQTDVSVEYLVDSNRVVYQILPCVETREDGFDEEKHGWPIVNSLTSFGYPTGYSIDPALYYEHGIGAYSFFKEKYETGLDFPWNGNCFGLSLLAIAQYTGQVDLKPYFNTSGTTLNEFGYDSVDWHEGGNRYVLYHYENGRVVYSNEIIKKIEQAQVSLYSSEISAIAEICDTWDLKKLVKYLSGNDPTPLLIGMWNYGHAVVTDTSMKPIYIGNERYLIPLYDCNAPQLTNELDDAWRPYSYSQSMLYTDLQSGVWGYWYKDKWRVVTDIDIFNRDDLKIYDVSALDKSFFNDHYSAYKHKTSIVLSADEVKIDYIDPGDGSQTTVFEYIDLQTWISEEVDFIPFMADEDISDGIQGCVILPEGSYIIKTKDDSYIQLINEDNMFVYGSDHSIEAVLDTDKNEITVRHKEAVANVWCVYANAKVDFCTGLEAKLSSGKSASLRTNSEKKTASVSTNAVVGDVTVIHVVDGEEVEDTSNMIHYHEDLSFVEGFEATCSESGQADHYICECGKIFADANAYKEIRSVVIPALDHVGEWIPAENPWEESRSCGRCGAEEVRIIANCLSMEPEDLGDHSAVWIEGVEYPVVNHDGQALIILPEGDSFHMTAYTFHIDDVSDIHTQFPISMKVWRIQKAEDGKYKATHIRELDDILRYSGMSIRVTGKKGIRMITSVDKAKKKALITDGLAGYILKEYGTVVAWANQLGETRPLVLGQPYARSNYAYKRGVADPVFAYSDNLIQYTNVLVGFTMDQCKEDIAMRPYMILEDAQGQQMTIYGGTVYRSIGYIAYQNRNVFDPGSAAYNYVWEIIHHVYGNKYDEEYKG